MLHELRPPQAQFTSLLSEQFTWDSIFKWATKALWYRHGWSGQEMNSKLKSKFLRYAKYQNRQRSRSRVNRMKYYREQNLIHPYQLLHKRPPLIIPSEPDSPWLLRLTYKRRPFDWGLNSPHIWRNAGNGHHGRWTRTQWWEGGVLVRCINTPSFTRRCRHPLKNPTKKEEHESAASFGPEEWQWTTKWQKDLTWQQLHIHRITFCLLQGAWGLNFTPIQPPRQNSDGSGSTQRLIARGDRSYLIS